MTSSLLNCFEIIFQQQKYSFKRLIYLLEVVNNDYLLIIRNEKDMECLSLSFVVSHIILFIVISFVKLTKSLCNHCPIASLVSLTHILIT